MGQIQSVLTTYGIFVENFDDKTDSLWYLPNTGTSESVAGVSPQPVCGVAFTGQVLEKPVAAPVSSNIFTGDTVRKDVGNEGSHSAQLMPQPSEQRNTRPMSRFKQKRQGLL